MAVRGIIFVFTLAAISHTVFAESFSDIQSDYTKWMHDTWPGYASGNRVPGYDTKIESYSLASFDVIRDNSSSFMKRLKLIDTKNLNKTTLLDHRLLIQVFQTLLDGYAWRMYGSLSPVTIMEGPQIVYSVPTIPLKTEPNFRDMAARQINIASAIDDMVVRMKKAVEVGRTLHNISVIGSIAQIKNRIKGLGSYPEIKKKLMASTLSTSLKKSLDGDIVQAVNGSLVPAYERLRDYIETEYLSNTRATHGVSGWPNGKEYYKACLKYHTGTNMTSQQVMDTGLSEVKRIGDLINKAIKRLGFNGLTITQFIEKIKTMPSMTFNTSDEIIAAYKKIIKRIDSKIRMLFHDDLITSPVRVVPMPVDSGYAYYRYKTENGTLVGTMTVNTFRPKEVLRHTLVALMLHESVPGHHLQITANSNSNLPIYRREIFYDTIFKTPYRYDAYTPYVEGWGLYAEYLGEELGVFEDDYELIGRYLAENLRAIRLVVDTGIHFFGWDRTTAVNYLMINMGRSRQPAERSIDRYITWPGQACAYKIGEMKIRELRRKAEKELGSKFNVKDFHSVCLKSSSVPLSILEELVDDYISEVKAQSTTTPTSGLITLTCTPNLVMALVLSVYIGFRKL